MRETQKVKRLRFAVPSVSPVLLRIAAKLDDPRFVGMQRQPELRESLAQLRPVLISKSGDPTLFVPGLESDQVKLWWVKDFESYFDFPGPVNRVRWIFERVGLLGPQHSSHRRRRSHAQSFA
jgi:hypothetical protein